MIRFVLTALCLLVTSAALADGPPSLTPRPVTDILHGVAITDPYRFLENSKAPETAAFAEAETAYTERVLERYPGRAALRARLDQLSRIGSLSGLTVAGDLVFYKRREGAENQPVLYVRVVGRSREYKLLDPNALSDKGAISLDWFVPSHDGRFVAFGLSANGTEISTLRVLELATGKLLEESITPARAAGVAWLRDDSGFYYGRPKALDVPPGKELYDIRLYRHVLGQHPDGNGDALVFGDDQGLSETDLPSAVLGNDDRFIAFDIARGYAASDFWVQDLAAGSPPVRVTDGREALYTPLLYRGTLYVLTNEGAPNFKLMAADARHPERSNWREIIPESDAVLTDCHIAGGRLVLEYQKDATGQLATADLDGRHRRKVTLPGLGTIDRVAAAWDRRDAYYQYESFDTPQTIFRLDMDSLATRPYLAIAAPGIDPHAITSRQVFFRSKDGTSVPMFIIAKAGTRLDGNNPTVLTGYGGFNIGLTPGFSHSATAWFERGGVWAAANLRGGDEYGEAWHRAGMLANKQNVFDDFTAAAQYLIREGWTRPGKLGAIGGSNGGLLVGVAITQHPELFRAAVSAVPLLDMLRYQNFEIAKLWVPEYGSADDPEQFKYLYAYSPYHHVVPGTLYPATLFLTADDDSRVAPLHALKMTALMQAQAKNGADPDRPILLRVEHDAGHGQGKSRAQQLDESTDIYTFLSWQLGPGP